MLDCSTVLFFIGKSVNTLTANWKNALVHCTSHPTMCGNVSLQAILMELSIDLYKTYLLSADNTGTSMRALLNPTSVGVVHLFSFLNHKRNFDKTLTLKIKLLTVLACIIVHVGEGLFKYCEELHVHSVLLHNLWLYYCYMLPSTHG